MRKTLLTIAFTFSVVLNVAVAGTLMWHWWAWDRGMTPQRSDSQALPSVDLRDMKMLVPSDWRAQMMENREKILEKRRDVLDLIAKDPGNPEAADKALDELGSLRAQQEKIAIRRMSKMMAAMPPEKRQAFVQLMKDRTCMGPGMGMGRGGCGGPGMRMRGPIWDRTE
jgi:Spy/CpxP family protein refolding chaperone